MPTIAPRTVPPIHFVQNARLNNNSPGGFMVCEGFAYEIDSTLELLDDVGNASRSRLGADSVMESTTSWEGFGPTLTAGVRDCSKSVSSFSASNEIRRLSSCFIFSSDETASCIISVSCERRYFPSSLTALSRIPTNELSSA